MNSRSTLIPASKAGGLARRIGLFGALVAGTTFLAAVPAHAKHHHKHHDAGAKVTSSTEKKHPQNPPKHHASGRHVSKIHTQASPTPRHVTASHVATGAAAIGAAAAAAAAAVPPPTNTPNGAVGAPPLASDDSNKGSNTGLPLPRFAALRADKVYMRRGPGDRYPIDWVYHRRGLPVEIEREFDVWRLVEDSDGQKGWVHQATLYGSRTFVIPGLAPEGVKAVAGEASAAAGDHIGRADARVLSRVQTQDEARAHKNDALLMSHPEEDSSVIAVLEPGTVGNIKACPQNSQWCRVSVKGYEGWLPRRLFWGLLPGETIQSN